MFSIFRAVPAMAAAMEKDVKTWSLLISGPSALRAESGTEGWALMRNFT